MIETMLADLVEPGRKLCYGIVQPGSVTASGAPILRVNNFGPNGLTVDDVLRIDPAIEAKYPRSRLRGGELLVTLVGSVGQSTIAPDDVAGWNVARAIGVVPIGDPILSKWANYVLKSGRAQRFLHERANTTVQTTINLRDLAALPIPLPPRDELEDIVSVLSMLDDKIELNRRMNETLEAQARALFRDWFVDFGPVKAKMAGNAPYLAPDLWSLFPDRLDDDAVPEGWQRGSLGMLSSLNPESWTAKNAPPRIEYVDLANTKWGYIEAVGSFDWHDAPSRGRRVLRPGDTIIGTVRPGNGSFAYVAQSGLTGSTGFAVLRPNSQEDRTLIWCAATNPENIARLSHLADGGAYPAVRPDVVLATPLVFPVEAALRQQFETVAGVLLDRIESNKTENQTLAPTRDLLLPKLMSGEIRIGGGAAL